MALQKQTVRMSANGGLDTKTDEKNVLPTNYLQLVNLRFTKTGAFTKRYGYARLTNDLLQSNLKIDSGKAVTTFQDELLRYSLNDLYSYSTAENKWIDKGVTKFALSSTYGVASNGFKLTNPDHATLFNLTVYVYEKTGSHPDNTPLNDVEYRVIDNITGSVLFTGEIVTARNPKIVGIQGTFFITYTQSGNLKYQTINFGTPENISAPVTITTDTSGIYDTAAIANRMYIVAPSTTSVKIMFVDNAGLISSPVIPTDAGVYNVVNINAENTSNVRVTFGNSSSLTALKTVLYSNSLTTQLSPVTTLEASITVNSISGIQNVNNVAQSVIWASISVSVHMLKAYTVDTTSTVINPHLIQYQAALQSKLQTYEGKVYAAVCVDNSNLDVVAPYTVFRTHFLLSEDGLFMNGFNRDQEVYRTISLPNLNIEGTTLAYAAALQAEIQANVQTTAIEVPTSILKLSSDFNTVDNYFDTQIGNNLMIAGGVMHMYDGDRVVEHGFLETPPAPQVVTATSGGVLTDGTYQYKQVFRWTDKWGQVHRSAPSLPLTVIVAAGTNEPTIAVFTLAFTEKIDVEIELYKIGRAHV